MGPRAGLDGRKISSPPGFDPGPSARRQSLYRLSYPAHKTTLCSHLILIFVSIINEKSFLYFIVTVCI